MKEKESDKIKRELRKIKAKRHLLNIKLKQHLNEDIKESKKSIKEDKELKKTLGRLNQ